MGTPIKDMVGKKFGRLFVVIFDKVKNGHAFWNCQCKCGNNKSIDGSKLRSGMTKSCGCLSAEIHSKLFIEKY
jgi:hypothetical protein